MVGKWVAFDVARNYSLRKKKENENDYTEGQGKLLLLHFIEITTDKQPKSSN